MYSAAIKKGPPYNFLFVKLALLIFKSKLSTFEFVSEPPKSFPLLITQLTGIPLSTKAKTRPYGFKAFWSV